MAPTYYLGQTQPKYGLERETQCLEHQLAILLTPPTVLHTDGVPPASGPAGFWEGVGKREGQSQEKREESAVREKEVIRTRAQFINSPVHSGKRLKPSQQDGYQLHDSMHTLALSLGGEGVLYFSQPHTLGS